MWQDIKFFFHIYWPRFMTEETAFVLTEEGYLPICAADDLTEFDEYDALGGMKFFNLFGRALYPKLVGELRLVR